MAGAFVDITVNETDIVERLRRIAGSDRADALREIGEHLQLSHRERWPLARSPEGVPWAPLSETTKARKEKNVDKILVESGDLSETLRYQLVGNDSLEFGTDRVYGATHQFGAKMGEFGRYSQIGRVQKFGLGTFQGSAGTQKGFPIPWGDIPARPFLGISDDDRIAILDILEGYLGRKIG